MAQYLDPAAVQCPGMRAPHAFLQPARPAPETGQQAVAGRQDQLRALTLEGPATEHREISRKCRPNCRISATWSRGCASSLT